MSFQVFENHLTLQFVAIHGFDSLMTLTACLLQEMMKAFCPTKCVIHVAAFAGPHDLILMFPVRFSSTTHIYVIYFSKVVFIFVDNNKLFYYFLLYFSVYITLKYCFLE